MTKIVYIDDYSPYGDGITSDRNALIDAMNACQNDGKVILGGGGAKYYIGEEPLYIPKGIEITGPGGMGGNNGYDQAWVNQLTAITMAPTAYLMLQSRTTLRNLALLPKGMIFPQSNSSNWSGLAISTNTGQNEVDITTDNVLAMGFFKAFDGYNCPRLNMHKFMFDAVYGVTVSNAGDPIRLHQVHGWPFATVSGPYGNSGLNRGGVAFEFTTNTDAGTVSDCFSGHYQTGMIVSDINGLRITNHGIEAPYNETATGFYFNGNTENIELVSVQAVGLQNGAVIDINNSAGIIRFNGGMMASNRDNNVRAFKGVAHLDGLNMRNGLPLNAHVGLISSDSKVIAQNCLYASKTFANYYNGASSNQLIAENNHVIG
jgi:hypothetical protein